MQINEIASEGLKHEFEVVVPASDLEAKVAARLNEMKGQVKLNGFRPGKVPAEHLRRVYGRSVMAETIDQVVRDTNTKIFTDRGFKLATEPKVTLPEAEDEVEKLLSGKSDLSYKVSVETIPQIELADFKSFKIEKPVVDVSDADVDEAIAKIAEQNRPFAEKAEGAKSEAGDRITISFIGRIDGVAFAGGTGDDIPVPIGSNTFIPGFEDQLIGLSVGETKNVKVTFPQNYTNADLAGKAAEFETTAKKIEAPQAIEANDEFAKSLGLESLDKLKEAARGRIVGEYAQIVRQRVKRQLFDQLDTAHQFDVPPTLIDEEFTVMWNSVKAEMSSAGRTFADEGTDEAKAEADYRKIAIRRVKLGLVLADIGEKNKIQVADDEVGRALVEKTRQFPGQEKQVWDYYRNNPQALAQLRAPIYEEKVVDFIIELANVTDKPMSREELVKQEEADSASASV